MSAARDQQAGGGGVAHFRRVRTVVVVAAVDHVLVALDLVLERVLELAHLVRHRGLAARGARGRLGVRAPRRPGLVLSGAF
jgi:hypothetical protein